MIDILNLLSLPFKLIWAVVSFPFSLVLNVVGFLIHSTWAIVSFPVNLVWNIGNALIGTAMSVILFFTNPFGVFSPQYAVEPSSALSVSVPLSQVDSSSAITSYQITDTVSDAEAAFSKWHPKSIRKDGETLFVSLASSRIDQEIYESAILNGFCQAVQEERAKFQGIHQVQILNEFSYSGRAFEGGVTECQELAEFSGRYLQINLASKTHMVPLP